MNYKIVLSCTLLVTLVLAKNGLTWGLASGNAQNNWIGSVGCGPCNPYNGDTDCEAYLPILCITNHKLFPQPSGFVCPNLSRPCWAGGIFTTTIPIRGADITKKDIADNQCKRQFGPNSKMAEHHDAWGWMSNGYVLSTWTGRAWTWINDQPNGNCGTL